MPACRQNRFRGNQVVTGEIWSGVLRGVWRAIWVVRTDQVFVVTVDGIDERRLIVQRDGGHDVVVDAKAARQQRLVVIDEQHPRQYSVDAGHDEQSRRHPGSGHAPH